MACKHGPVVSGVTGMFFLILGAVSFPFVKWIIKSTITERVLLKNGTEAFDIWQNPPVPIYLQVWVFDLLNPDEVLAGGKPNVTQRGPYTYREYRRKVDLHFYDNGTVSYRQIKTYHFMRHLSVSWDNDTFTTANIPYMTLVSGFQWQNKVLQDIISSLLNILFRNEGVFLKRTVREIVWGYVDPILHFAKTLDRNTFNTDFIGVLMGKNDTDDGVYTVFTGEQDIGLLGVIDRYNGAKSVNFWSTRFANMVNGTDGSVGPPFINKSMTTQMFSTDICRSVYGLYHDSVKTLEDITLYRFTSTRAGMASAAVNPDNAGFCTPAGNCLGTGVLNISTCQIVDTFHLPIIASAPHFYLADQKYVDAVTNMKPDPAEHATFIDIEPNTGFVMQVNKRLQINIYLKKEVHFSKTAKLSEIVYPVLWVNESATTDEAHARRIKRELLLPQFVLNVTSYLLVTVGGVIFMVTIIKVILNDLHSTRRTSAGLLQADIDDLDQG